MVDRGLLLQVFGHAIYIAIQISLAEHILGLTTTPWGSAIAR